MYSLQREDEVFTEYGNRVHGYEAVGMKQLLSS